MTLTCTLGIALGISHYGLCTVWGLSLVREDRKSSPPGHFAHSDGHGRLLRCVSNVQSRRATTLLPCDYCSASSARSCSEGLSARCICALLFLCRLDSRSSSAGYLLCARSRRRAYLWPGEFATCARGKRVPGLPWSSRQSVDTRTERRPHGTETSGLRRTVLHARDFLQKRTSKLASRHQSLNGNILT